MAIVTVPALRALSCLRSLYVHVADISIGTDIGGSIRNPCANCGLFGFKPCASRLPKSGNMSGMPNQESIVGAIGPMGVSARDMELFVKVQLAAQPWRVDPSVVKMPWRPEEVSWIGGDKPRIGVQWNDGVVVPQPPMRTALVEAVDKLKAAGFEVVEVKPRKTAEAWALLKQLYFTDGGARVRREAARTGEPVLALTEWVMTGATEQTSAQVMELVRQREAFRKEYAAYWEQQNIDIMLLPAMPGPANVLGTSKYWNYTAFYNLVDYPGAVFPTRVQVDPGNPDHAADKPREYLSEDDKRTAEECEWAQAERTEARAGDKARARDEARARNELRQCGKGRITSSRAFNLTLVKRCCPSLVHGLSYSRTH